MPTMINNRQDQENAIISVAISTALVVVFTVSAILFFVYALPMIQEQTETRSQGLIIDASLPYSTGSGNN